MKRVSQIFVAALCALATFAAVATAASAQTWVGLGDSFAAGPLIPDQTLSPLGCLRSDSNYAHQAAATLGYTLTDVSCSGAETEDMFNAQSTDAGTNPPQLDALDSGTDVVTLQIGGNDIGFTEILQNCVTYNPFGRPCRNRYTAGGSDQIAARIRDTAPKVDAVIDGIKALAPAARVIVLNYAAILPETGSGCWPQVPFAYADVPYLRAKQQELNAMLAAQAAANDVAFVDDYTASIGRDACRSARVRWVEPLVPGNAAAPFHPNARGMQGIAPLVLAASGA
jgi:lysophospholipase L1-like esterase